MSATQPLLDLDFAAIPSLAPPQLGRAEFGTFKDSLRAPIHRWFTYPAGFSFKAVEEGLRMFEIRAGQTLYEPFGGTATTNIVAQQNGVHSWGIEAHPFVAFVGQTKLFWQWEFADLQCQIDQLIEQIRDGANDSTQVASEDVFPELVCKCYSKAKLHLLWVCREAILAVENAPFRNLAKLGLTNLLRALADVETGWPYIAPGKPKTSSPDVMGALRNQLYAMAGDLMEIKRASKSGARTEWLHSDSRLCHPQISAASADLSFTSPPYLNNYDYADRTRLETYFWGEAKTWGDITQKVRKRLMMSATTQANRTGWDEENPLSEELQLTAPKTAAILKNKVRELSALRTTKGGKKSYDMMVAGYFNDMLPILRETHRVLRKGAPMVMILGDSAPYGVHIETDVLLGEIGVEVGFSRVEIEDLRKRGDKWKNNPQRHTVALKESVVTLTK